MSSHQNPASAQAGMSSSSFKTPEPSPTKNKGGSGKKAKKIGFDVASDQIIHLRADVQLQQSPSQLPATQLHQMGAHAVVSAAAPTWSTSYKDMMQQLQAVLAGQAAEKKMAKKCVENNNRLEKQQEKMMADIEQLQRQGVVQERNYKALQRDHQALQLKNEALQQENQELWVEVTEQRQAIVVLQTRVTALTSIAQRQVLVAVRSKLQRRAGNDGELSQTEYDAWSGGLTPAELPEGLTPELVMLTAYGRRGLDNTACELGCADAHSDIATIRAAMKECSPEWASLFKYAHGYDP